MTGVFGADTIVDSGGEDLLVFREGISMDDLLFANGSLRIYTADGSVDVHIENFDPADAQNPAIELLAFADTGVVVSTAWLLEQRMRTSMPAHV